MKTTINVLFLVGIIFLGSSCTSHSTGKVSTIETGKFGGGIAAAAMVHEGGHYIAAKAEGMNNVKFHPTKVTYEYDKYSKSAKRNIAMAGPLADIIGCEIMMSNDKWFPKDNNFILGYLTWTMLQPVAATLRYELGLDGKYNDLRDLKETGVNPQMMEIGLLAHSALTYYRLRHNPKSPLYVEASPRKVLLGAKWEF